MPKPRFSRGASARLCDIAAVIIVCIAAVIFACGAADASTLAWGDSLAKGTGAAMGVKTVARVGASSCAILGSAPRGHFDRVVISAGTNDPPGACVEAVREAIDAGRVVWILPINGARKTVLAVARAHGDSVVTYAPSRRNWPHPRNYGPLAKAVEAAW